MPILRLGVATIAIVLEKESVLLLALIVGTTTTASILGEVVLLEAITANRIREVREISLMEEDPLTEGVMALVVAVIQ